jgi:hypothetical protein
MKLTNVDDTGLRDWLIATSDLILHQDAVEFITTIDTDAAVTEDRDPPAFRIQDVRVRGGIQLAIALLIWGSLASCVGVVVLDKDAEGRGLLSLSLYVVVRDDVADPADSLLFTANSPPHPPGGGCDLHPTSAKFREAMGSLFRQYASVHELHHTRRWLKEWKVLITFYRDHRMLPTMV